jgi:site-specific DNA recombinase
VAPPLQVVPPSSTVEVPGIEPGSFVALPELLRAQLAMPLLGPSDHASESV